MRVIVPLNTGESYDDENEGRNRTIKDRRHYLSNTWRKRSFEGDYNEGWQNVLRRRDIVLLQSDMGTGKRWRKLENGDG